ncbi:MAG: hypothetical protein AAF591_07480 [Verrucomicrobiota bacterium]
MKQQKQFLIGLLVVLVLALAGSGYYFMSSRGAFNESMGGFDAQRTMIATLEKKPLYPNAENVGLIEESVLGYQAEVANLQSALLGYQKSLNESMTQPEFRTKLQETVDDFEEGAEAVGMALPEDFYMGMLRYRNEIPRAEAVPLLNYQLGSIDNLARILANSGASELDAIERGALPIESDGYDAEGGEQEPLEKYPVQIAFSGPHKALQGFFNRVSNDEEYFYIIRYVRIESSMKEGPERVSDDFGGGFDDFSDDADDFASGAGDQGGTINYDANVIMGQETLKCLAVVDLVRVAELDLEVDSSGAEKEVQAVPDDSPGAGEAAGGSDEGGEGESG